MDPVKNELGSEKRLNVGAQAAPRLKVPHALKAGMYLAFNVVSATCIIFANKMVFSVIHFRFVYALTLVHVLTTLLGMHVFAAIGLYERRPLPVRPLLSLAAAFVGYIICWNVSLQINTVGFYQLSKICVTPVVLVFDALAARKPPSSREVAAVAVLCTGVVLATVADKQVATNALGLAVAAAAIGFTAVYQVYVGSKQKQLEAGSMVLMAGYTPIASIMLGVLVPIFEPIGYKQPGPETLLGFPYTPHAVGAIALTAILGLLVSLSTFLVIGATSSVTYNVVGHVKTVIVLGGGCLLFNEDMPLKRLVGISLALAGIFWYSALKMRRPGAVPQLARPAAEPLLKDRAAADKIGLGEKQRSRASLAMEPRSDSGSRV